MVIITRILGGLGNQLFCYSAARRMAFINRMDLRLDAVSGFSHDHLYRRQYQLDHFSISAKKANAVELMEPFSRARRLLKRKINQYRVFSNRKYIQQEGIDFDPRLLTVRPQGTLYLEGYWQSEMYFKDIESTIRQDLEIIPPTDAENVAMAKHIAKCDSAVAIHVRYFDAPDETATNNAPSDYYARAIAHMEHIAPDAHYFVFSDQPAVARQRLPLSEDRMTLVSHNRGDVNAYADLWLMTGCRHFIIANSTFSWWGAWLATFPGKRVIAPGFETRQGKMYWGFEGLLPDEWIKL